MRMNRSYNWTLVCYMWQVALQQGKCMALGLSPYAPTGWAHFLELNQSISMNNALCNASFVELLCIKGKSINGRKIYATSMVWFVAATSRPSIANGMSQEKACPKWGQVLVPRVGLSQALQRACPKKGLVPSIVKGMFQERACPKHYHVSQQRACIIS